MRTSKQDNAYLFGEFDGYQNGEDFVSDVFSLEHLYLYCISVEVTGSSSLSGTVRLESCVHGRKEGLSVPASDATWVVITEPRDTRKDLTDLNGDGTITYNVVNPGYRFVRCSSTGLSGSATFKVLCYGKGV